MNDMRNEAAATDQDWVYGTGGRVVAVTVNRAYSDHVRI